MRLVFLVPNQAFVFLFGDALVDVDGKRIFNTREDAVWAAKMCGLTVATDGRVS